MSLKKKNDDAVSPVIGVILMVAVTVILAGIIAAFLFGMAGNMQKAKIVAATVQHRGQDLVVTYNGGQDALRLTSYNVTVLDETTPRGNNILPVVGSSSSYTASGPNNHVVVVGNFDDGSQQVILNTYA